MGKKLKGCCAQKMKHYIDYARQKCGEHAIEDVCKAPNGYEPRFDSEGLGAAKHFPKTPCVASAWSAFETMTIADKNTFAQEQAAKMDLQDNKGLQDLDVVLDDAVSGKAA